MCGHSSSSIVVLAVVAVIVRGWNTESKFVSILE